MMSIEDVTKIIESSEFSAKINIASGRELFIRILNSDSVVVSLINLIKEQPETISIRILSRVEQFCHLKINPHYENPNDVALATYCWALHQVSPDIGKVAAAFISSAQGIWWARELANQILENNLAAQNKSALNISTTFSKAQDFTYNLMNYKPTSFDLFPIPVSLISGIGKYIITNNFTNRSEHTNKPIPQISEWRNIKKTFSYKTQPSLVRDTVLSANWSL